MRLSTIAVSIALSPLCHAQVDAQHERYDVGLGVTYVQEVHSLMRDPDSFVLERVLSKPSKYTNINPSICVFYRSRNGFGGYTAGVYAFESDKKGRVKRYNLEPTYNLVQKECGLNKDGVDITSDVNKFMPK
jgi:hypothetical protein